MKQEREVQAQMFSVGTTEKERALSQLVFFSGYRKGQALTWSHFLKIIS